MPDPTIADHVAAVRSFNRSYTKFLGTLNEHLLDSPYSLTEARVLFELGQQDALEVTRLRAIVELDPGYLSRLLGRFETRGLIRRERSTADARRQVIRLTDAGRDTFTELDVRSAEQIRGLLTRLTTEERHQLAAAMGMIRTQLDRSATPTLRPPTAGDYGWVIERNGALYAAEHGWNSDYEALVARIVADYLADHDPDREAGWIAELNGERVGAVFCVRTDKDPATTTAKLRLLHVEPRARGAGVGGALVDACIQFARKAGYDRIELWTVSLLAPARRIYQRAGFALAGEEHAELFGHQLTGQTWRLIL